MYYRHKAYIYHLFLSFIEYFFSKTKMTKILIQFIRYPLKRATKSYICDTLKNMATPLISSDIVLGVPFLCFFAYYGPIFHPENCNICQNQCHIRNQHRKLSRFSQVSNNSEYLYFYRKSYPYSPSGNHRKMKYVKNALCPVVRTINDSKIILDAKTQNISLKKIQFEAYQFFVYS